ncbi:PRC-barrel domain-containing protein [Salipiger mucosus]|uniref:PRC-barrel domain-containing protein n=1 Tax=Salipiger mucosus DSM 16094 TaxID=1123237 RepID=S9QAW0_9RHOB|nr:PRC-barrel domain-containing protein [Salipiger mucosus]EPX78511.1 hypothetical protein Salmuc_03622 [Salipiger mucosus DSM 16094]
MLMSFHDLRSYGIHATDRQTGSINDFYFDDHDWRVRYLVAHTGFLLTGRETLVGAARLGTPDAERMELPINLSADELRTAEPAEAHPPANAQRHAAQVLPDTGFWAPYLVGTELFYTPTRAQEQLVQARDESGAASAEDSEDMNLRSMIDVTGYTIAAKDGEIGSVCDFLIDPEDWKLQHVVVDTGHWLPGRRVAITTRCIKAVDGLEQRIHVEVSRQEIEEAPKLDTFDDLLVSPYERYGSLGIWPA